MAEMTVDKTKAIELVKLMFPNAQLITDPQQIKAFNDFKAHQDQLMPEVWNLKDFATNVYKQPKSTKRALSYLFRHRDELDVRNSGFINFDATHNGWKIPSDELIEFNRQHQYHWE